MGEMATQALIVLLVALSLVGVVAMLVLYACCCVSSRCSRQEDSPAAEARANE